MAWLRTAAVDRAQDPATGASPGIERHRANYRKSGLHLHPWAGCLRTAFFVPPLIPEPGTRYQLGMA